MKQLKENLAEIVYLVGLVFLVTPAYMIDIRAGMALTGVACLATALGIAKDGE